MTRFTLLASFCAALAITGCTGRISHEVAEPSGSSTTVVEVCPLNSSPSAQPNPQPPIVVQDGTGNLVVFGDVEHHRDLHIHKDPEPTKVRVDVRVHVDLTDDREQRRRLVERRLTEFLERR